jgi:hypothetical protein
MTNLPVIVVYRNGQRVILNGWRAWLIIVPAVLLGAVAFLAVAGLFFGIAFTAAGFFLIGLPIAVVLAFIVQLFQARRY